MPSKLVRSSGRSFRWFPAFVAVLALLAATPASAAKIYVNGRNTTPDDTGCGTLANPCNTIQAGVDNAAAGDKIYVRPGKYYESVTVDKDDLLLSKWPLTRGKVVIDPEDAVPVCDDATRTIFAGGPYTEACRQFDGDEASCEAAYAINSEVGAVSCWWDGMSCRGCGPNNQWTCTNTCGGGFPDAIIIEASNVSVKKVSIRNGQGAGIRVLPGATGASIARVKASGLDRECIDTQADGTSVARSKLVGCGRACIEAAGNNFTASANVLKQCNDEGIFFSGLDATIAGNTFFLCNEDCIEGYGNGIINGNVIQGGDDNGIFWLGESMTIEENSVSSTADEGIEVVCAQTSCGDASRTVFAGGPYTSACRQFDNQMDCEAAWAMNDQAGAVSCWWDGMSCRGCGPSNQWTCTNTCYDSSATCTGLLRRNDVALSLEDECFRVNGFLPGLSLKGNTATSCNDEGFYVEGEEVTMVNNSAVGNGAWSAAGFHLEGMAHTLTGNVSTGNQGDGYLVTGIDHVLDSNTARANLEDGFDVDSAMDVHILNNTSTKNYGIGIEITVNATSVEVSGNTASGNRTDYCDEGTGTVESGNSFGTTGPCGVEGGGD